jgi:preprotein translocase subunit SecE
MANQAEKTITKSSQFDRLVLFLKEVRGEVAKVTWPNSNEVKSATVVVIVVCIIVAIVIWSVDKLIQMGMKFIF